MNRVFIDVREPHEFNRDRVAGAINLPPSEIMAGAPSIAHIDKDTELVLYCMSGNRSNSSIMYLRKLGYTNLVNGINKDQIKHKYGV